MRLDRFFTLCGAGHASQRRVIQSNNKSKRHGGTHLPDDLPVRANPLFAFHKALTERQIELFRPFWDSEGKFSAQTPILIDYLREHLPQASAFTYNNQNVIGIHCGVILILEFMFNSLMCRPDFLPHIGDPRAERDDPGHTAYNQL